MFVAQVVSEISFNNKRNFLNYYILVFTQQQAQSIDISTHPPYSSRITLVTMVLSFLAL